MSAEGRHLSPSNSSASSNPLKRPRDATTLDPEASSSCSSPKRANSEDNTVPSSPGLEAESDGMDIDAATEVGASSDLEAMRLGESAVLSQEQLAERWKEIEDAVAETPTAGAEFYIVPQSYLDNFKALATGSSKDETLTQAALQSLDLSILIDDDRVFEDVQMWLPTPESKLDPEVKGVKGLGKIEKRTLSNIREGLEEGIDYGFISAAGWNKLVAWYGPATPSTGLPRLVNADGIIEVMPMILTTYLVQASPTSSIPLPASTAEPTPVSISVPRTTPVTHFLPIARLILLPNQPPYALRLWELDIASTLLPSQSISELPANIPVTLSIPAERLPSLNAKVLSLNRQLSITESGLNSGDHIAFELPLVRTGSGDDLNPSDATKCVYAVKVNEQGRPIDGDGSVDKPKPLFSQAPKFGGHGSGSSTAVVTEKKGMETRSQAQQSGQKDKKGLVGLSNLGNTCFLNSATQCLSNTYELSSYFQSGVYREELNRDNPLGMHGQVADAFGRVMEALWAGSSTNASSSSYFGSSSAFSPREFKSVISRFAPSFAGYGQHDTQEFLAFLLDGLHEDLNRIHKKPYVEKPDWKAGGGMKELAALGKECWDGYKRRNDSVIVDLFQGQLQSTLVCPECTQESITMDPFMYLTVPLPIKQTKIFKATVFPLDPLQGKYELRMLLNQNASLGQVKEKIGQLTGVNANKLIGFDMWKNAIYQYWNDNDSIHEIKDNDVAVYHELTAPVVANHRNVAAQPTDDTIVVPVGTSRFTEGRFSSSTDLVSEPFFITLTKSEASDPQAIREVLTRAYARFVSPELRSSMYAPPNSHKVLDDELPEEEETPVTEIHVDNGETRVEVVPSSASIKSSVSEAAVSPAVSVSSLPSGAHIARPDLFKITVAPVARSGMSFRSSKRDEMPQLYKLDGVPSDCQPINARRKPKKHLMSKIASGINSIVGGYTSEGDDESSQTSSSGPSSPAPLLVNPGEAIICEWTPAMYSHFIEKHKVETANVVDPALQAEIGKSKEKQVISIENCLDEFSKEEVLGQDDLWYCPNCKKHQAASKRIELYKVPDILVICIKRFGSSRRLSDKLDNLVEFPVDGLDLGSRIGERKVADALAEEGEDVLQYGLDEAGEPMIYDLYAVDNHFGGMGGGHYTAFCKNKDDGQWYNFDDSRVSKASASDVQSRAAYLLFYRRRTSKPIGGISRVKTEVAEKSRANSRDVSPSRTASAAGPSSLSQVASGPASPPVYSDAIESDDDSPFVGARSRWDDSRSTSPAVSSSGGDTAYHSVASLAQPPSTLSFGGDDRWNLGSKATSSSVTYPWGSILETSRVTQVATPPDSDDEPVVNVLQSRIVPRQTVETEATSTDADDVDIEPSSAEGR